MRSLIGFVLSGLIFGLLFGGCQSPPSMSDGTEPVSEILEDVEESESTTAGGEVPGNGEVVEVEGWNRSATSGLGATGKGGEELSSPGSTNPSSSKQPSLVENEPLEETTIDADPGVDLAEEKSSLEFGRLRLGLIDSSSEEEKIGALGVRRAVESAFRKGLRGTGLGGGEFEVLPETVVDLRAGTETGLFSLAPPEGGREGTGRCPIVLGSATVLAPRGGARGRGFAGISLRPGDCIEVSEDTFRKAGPGREILFSLDRFERSGRPDNFVEYRFDREALDLFRRSGVLLSSDRTLEGKLLFRRDATEDLEEVPFSVEFRDDGALEFVSDEEDYLLTGSWGPNLERVFLFEVTSFRGDLGSVLRDLTGGSGSANEDFSRFAEDDDPQVIWLELRGRRREGSLLSPP